jgi:Predicted ATPase of the PP-loop superfamily implicated in cell cycle control
VKGVLTALLKSFARACKEFDLLAEGDRVAVALSGGKDSTSLLDLMLRYRERAGVSYDVMAVHVVSTAAGFPDQTGVLAPWLEARGWPTASSRWNSRRMNRCRPTASAAPGTTARRFSWPPTRWAATNWPWATTPTTPPSPP